MQNQLYLFFIFILNGILIGLIFDCFRILRKSFKTPDIITYIEDILFGIITGLILLYSTFTFNEGELRVYTFVGVFTGLLLYMLLFSKIFINVSVYIIKFIKKIINIIIIVPLKFIGKILKKIFFKPIVFVCINVKNKIRKIKFHKIKFKFKNKKSIS